VVLAQEEGGNSDSAPQVSMEYKSERLAFSLTHRVIEVALPLGPWRSCSHSRQIKSTSTSGTWSTPCTSTLLLVDPVSRIDARTDAFLGSCGVGIVAESEKTYFD